MDMKETGNKTSSPPVCAGEPSVTNAFAYGEDEDDHFTPKERDALERLHRAGWNGNGVDIFINDVFIAGSRSHGTSVRNMAKYYAPNATIHESDQRGGANYSGPFDVLGSNTFYIENNSYAAPGSADELLFDQTDTIQDTAPGDYGAWVWGAGNADGLIPGDPDSAKTAMEENGFVWAFANELPGQNKRIGRLLNVKSGILIVGAVDPGPDTDSWTLASGTFGGTSTHSARAGHARHAFIVAPDDNLDGSPGATSFAAPRVTGALAVLRQKCPRLSAQELGFILLRSADRLGEGTEDEPDDVYGWGLMNLESALQNAKKLAAEFKSYDATVEATS